MSAKKIIFALDDDARMGEVYRELLADEYEVHCFSISYDFLNRLNELKPHLMIIDINLGPINGYQMCEALKQKGEMEDIPVVLVSEQDVAEDKSQAFFSGGSEYVTKPIQAAPFCALLARMIEDHWGNQWELDA